MPFILRPATAETKTLVAGAYVHGVMDSEGYHQALHGIQSHGEQQHCDVGSGPSQQAQGTEQADEQETHYPSKPNLTIPERVTLA